MIRSFSERFSRLPRPQPLHPAVTCGLPRGLLDYCRGLCKAIVSAPLVVKLGQLQAMFFQEFSIFEKLGGLSIGHQFSLVKNNGAR